MATCRRTAQREQLELDVLKVKREMEAGLRVEFPVERSLISQVIGVRGANVKRVQSESGVHRIVVDKDYGVIRIVGSRRCAPLLRSPAASLTHSLARSLTHSLAHSFAH